MSSTRLPVELLTREAFAPFGDVIDAASAVTRYPVNAGTSERFHDLARIDVAANGGRAVLSLFRATPCALPVSIRTLERHMLGSQAFIPAHPATRFLIVVAESSAACPRAFLAQAGQGVNYHRGTWHHPLIGLDQPGDFWVIDRAGKDVDCEEIQLPQTWQIDAADLDLRPDQR